jgi:hypothetical protein
VARRQMSARSLEKWTNLAATLPIVAKATIIYPDLDVYRRSLGDDCVRWDCVALTGLT